MDEPLYVTIKTDEEDFMGFQALVPTRMQKFEEAPDTQIKPEVPYINQLAARLHPARQMMKVESIKDLTPTIKLIRLCREDNGEVAFFRPGQYITVDMKIGESLITRPYSIASSPADSLDGYYELAVRNDENGFAAKYLYNELKVGDVLKTSGPAGHFYWDSIRDSKNVIGLAGGSGITPFRSMARAIVDGTIDCSMTLIYGVNTEDDIAFHDEFVELEKKSNGKFKAVFVLANEEKEGYEHGFITTDVIDRHADAKSSSFFICGPQGMYNFLTGEIAKYQKRRKFVRFELFGQPRQISSEEGFPKDQIGKTYTLTIHQADNTYTIPAKSEETLVIAMERAGIRPPTKCRSGACGFCRSMLVEGDVYVSRKDDGRRYGDKQFGFIHPCASFPLSDCELIVPPAK